MLGAESRHLSRSLVPPIAICVCLFLTANALLVSKAWFLDGYRLILLVSIPLSQCSLASIWAGCSRAPLPLRFAVPTFAWVAGWCVLARNLNWGTGDDAAAAWSLALGIQTFVVSVTVVLQQRFASRAIGDGQGHNGKPVLRLSIGSLILWTTVIALGFAFQRYAHRALGWTATSSNWDYRAAILAICLFNAFIALLWHWAMVLHPTTRRSRKIAVVAGLVCLGATLLPQAVEWIGGVREINTDESLALALAQSALLWFWLVFLTPRSFKARRSRG